MSAKKKPSPSPLRQCTLNFGQRPVKTFECQECGMIYNLNDKRDEQAHMKHHSEKDNVLKYNIHLKNEKIVQNYIDGKCVVIEYAVDSSQSLHKATQVLEYVDTQLGINENLGVGSAPKKINNTSKFYFFISSLTKKIVGFCLAEKIDKAAYRIKYLNENHDTFSYDETKAETAICGINRIWVSPDARRQKIATRLLECVCLNFLYICRLNPNKDLAFSDPTQMGRNLAHSFCNNQEFLIYNLSNN